MQDTFSIYGGPCSPRQQDHMPDRAPYVPSPSPAPYVCSMPIAQNCLVHQGVSKAVRKQCFLMSYAPCRRGH